MLTLTAALALALLTLRAASPAALWLTADQQGRLAYENGEWDRTIELFDDPMWKATTAYRLGQYEAAADTFGRIPNAEGFFGRGNALMKSFDYGKAIAA